MPNLSIEEIKLAVLNNKISAITVETNIFEAKKFGFEFGQLGLLEQIKKSSIQFLIPDVVEYEIISHLERDVRKDIELAKSLFKSTGNTFGYDKETRQKLYDQTFGSGEAKEIAENRFKKYINTTGVNIIKSSEYAKLDLIIYNYLNELAPFSKQKPKEFVDAIALSTLDGWASNNGGLIIAVSNDMDWQNYCDQSKNLVCINDIAKMLDLLNASAQHFKDIINDLIVNGQLDLANEILPVVSSVGNEFEVEFIANSFLSFEHELVQVECMPNNISNEELIEIAEIVEFDEVSLTLSFEIPCNFNVEFDVSFEVWDSIDKESIYLGGNSYETSIKKNITAYAFFDFDEGNAVFSYAEAEPDSLRAKFGTIEPYDHAEPWEEYE